MRTIEVEGPLELAAVCFALKGPGGATSHFRHGVLRRATFNEAGPVQLAVRRLPDAIEAEAWGPGAFAELDTLPALLGLDDDPTQFRPAANPLAQLVKRFSGLRLGATGRVFEVLAPTILAQRVTSREAKLGYSRLSRALAAPAPGPAGMLLPLRAEAVADLSYEDLHRFGIERGRALVLREAARRAKRLEEITTMERTAAYARLEAVRGIGPWTSGHVMGIAWGDRDAVPVGDFHLPNTVAWVLAGEPRADDERMLELLEPSRPHRRRVVLMLKRSGAGAPKFGPRVAVQDIRGR